MSDVSHKWLIRSKFEDALLLDARSVGIGHSQESNAISKVFQVKVPFGH